MATSSVSRTYNDAIDTLNTFQTPWHIIEERKKAGIRPDAESIREMKIYLARIGYSLDDLTRLNILHVAGTKGKGSTCAFQTPFSPIALRTPTALRELVSSHHLT